MKRLIVTVAALMFVLVPLAPFASASAVGAGPAAQDPVADETAAYKAWYDAYTNKDNAKRVELGKAFIEKFPNSKNVAYVKADIANARGDLLKAAVTAKNIPEIVRLTKEALADNGDSADFPYFLTLQLRTLDTSFQYAADTTWAAETGIRFLQEGKPFKAYKDIQKNTALAFYNETLALIDDRNDKNGDKALGHYYKAAELEPMNPIYFYQCGRIHTSRYNAASTAYDKFPEADKSAPEPKPEVKAAADLVNAEADGVINCWARFLGLTATDLKGFKPEVRQAVKKSVGDLYEYRNNGKQDGLEKLIDDNKASATPVKMAPPVKPAPQKAEDEAGAKPGSPAAPGTTAKPTARKPHS